MLYSAVYSESKSGKPLGLGLQGCTGTCMFLLANLVQQLVVVVKPV